MDSEAWQAIVHEVERSQTRLSDFTLHVKGFVENKVLSFMEFAN